MSPATVVVYLAIPVLMAVVVYVVLHTGPQ